MSALRDKYGPNWGLSESALGRKAVPTREQARAALIAQIGQEAFDAMPDVGYDWKQFRLPKQAAE